MVEKEDDDHYINSVDQPHQFAKTLIFAINKTIPMKILHTADLHIGQILYQNYERCDEHLHFFEQLTRWCKEEQPDVLLVSGDVFDIQQPSTATKKLFNEQFVKLQKEMPDMHIVITAGNHDSASRLQADRDVWTFSNTHLVGVAPSLILNDGWEDDYIIELPSGFIVAMPYMLGDRSQQLQSVLDRVAQRNTDGRPVVMMGHLAVTGSDITGHDFEIGTLKTQSLASLGTGYDYLALGHIHKPQTLGHPEDSMNMEAIAYPAPVARYSGSALHVSCDETYPHTVSVVDIDHHGGQVTVRQLRIDELRHFYTLPEDPNAAFADEEEALEGVKSFCQTVGSGYIRLKVQYSADLSANFAQKVYDILESRGNEVRYNPKTLWIGEPEKSQDEIKQTLMLAEIQQMNDPMEFIEKTKTQYPNLDFHFLNDVIKEIEAEVERIKEKEAAKQAKKTNDSTTDDTTNPEQE